MTDKILLWYIILDLLFVATGAVILVFTVTTQQSMAEAPSVLTIGTNLLMMQTPLGAGIVNAAFVFAAFLLSLPAMALPTTRGWLKLHGYAVGLCGVFTLIMGLDIWIDTLKTRQNLFEIWQAQPATTQSLLQQELSCCGYFNSTTPMFVTDSTCPNAAVAAMTVGCISPFSKLANSFLDVVFTTAFLFVGLDVILIISIVIVLKDRKEKERYRVIDEKNAGGF